MTIDKFVKNLSEMQRKYPGDAGDALEKGAKKMVRGLKKDTPASEKDYKDKLNKSWRLNMVEGKEPKAEIRNKSSHFHLVERGVQNPKDFKGRPRPEWRAAMNKHRGFVEKSVEKHWPDVQKMMEREFFRKVSDRLD